MMLVDLEQARQHLRVLENSGADEDVATKVEQASDIVLDYLHRRAVVVSSSVANPSVITTERAHGFLNGESVTIAGHLGSTPSLNATAVISNVTDKSFTVPTAVTVAGTGGSAALTWTADTAPGTVQAAVLLVLGHLYEHRGDDQRLDEDLWQALGRLLGRSRDPVVA